MGYTCGTYDDRPLECTVRNVNIWSRRNHLSGRFRFHDVLSVSGGESSGMHAVANPLYVLKHTGPTLIDGGFASPLVLHMTTTCVAQTSSKRNSH